ncbi:FtsK/SpoIIIE domain-containing protein [Nocardiopsis sp. NRRL B-16309]|uniref:FtsK/SpoIIIE domain-containing protein n=1 Tax=Nocardiopsis sp. NRRL B-16309 TaxID=1519494 RepID=UPI0006AF1DCF|nr:FtsK/SpoIIIE domain-containing protein [Nocardiopsis sp. NRRL B-16309]KOX10108.1 hypothetical protein ADL05_25835 [Nocardiopsis sp. NRRL B-16309]
MTAELHTAGSGAEVIDFASRRRTPTVEEVPEPELITGRRRKLPTLPAGVGGVVLAAPKNCVCRIGRGTKKGGDTWGHWVREKGHRVERAKKTLWWAAGTLVVLAWTAPFGIIAAAVVGLTAAVVAGAPAKTKKSAAASPVEAGGGVAPPAPVDGTSTVEAGASMPTESVEAPTPPTDATTVPVQAPSVPRGGRVPVGPPSTSPLVGRTTAVDVWTEPVRWGIDAYGAPVETVLPGNPGLLTGGVSGSGKSVASHQMLCHVALDPHAQLWLVDGKMLELVHYEDIAHRRLGGPDLDAFGEMVDDLDAEIQRRTRAIAGKTVKITGRNWQQYDAPFILLHVDEIQLFTLQGKEGKELAQRLALLASVCRALGVFISVATQRPEDSVVPPLLCNNLVLKLGMRTEDAAQSNTVLGNGMAGRGYRSDRFTGDQKGAAYFRGEVGDPTALTTGFLRIPDEDEGGPDHVRDIVAHATELRREAETLPVADNRPPRADRLEVASDALDAMEEAGVDRMSRVDLAAAMGWDEEELRSALTRAGVCSPHPLAGVSGRGWYRKDLAALMR